MCVTIYHNPSCSKSRETLALLEAKYGQPKIELYLEQQFSASQLQQIAQKLGVTSFREMMRTKDELYRDLGLDKQEVSEQQLLEALVAHSSLLERPIVIHGDKAKIGRPPESVLEIL
ncbi:arsenate reductase (glutaredoxin) [Pasteurella multocida]|uniref:arsenate reductase (glutaredoxin) n=1 Tax=Pasteurella multocida TaxID=747 RepID=UPI002B83A4B5|nr:arsenate reductase (glutaredoxin) [Pasteurella multocida]MEB3480901.1 arsenate reductase (glutaredoxin) [Pasteurella multocida]